MSYRNQSPYQGRGRLSPEERKRMLSHLGRKSPTLLRGPSYTDGLGSASPYQGRGRLSPEERKRMLSHLGRKSPSLLREPSPTSYRDGQYPRPRLSAREREELFRSSPRRYKEFTDNLRDGQYPRPRLSAREREELLRSSPRRYKEFTGRSYDGSQGYISPEMRRQQLLSQARNKRFYGQHGLEQLRR